MQHRYDPERRWQDRDEQRDDRFARDESGYRGQGTQWNAEGWGRDTNRGQERFAREQERNQGRGEGMYGSGQGMYGSGQGMYGGGRSFGDERRDWSERGSWSERQQSEPYRQYGQTEQSRSGSYGQAYGRESYGQGESYGRGRQTPTYWGEGHDLQRSYGGQYGPENWGLDRQQGQAENFGDRLQHFGQQVAGKVKRMFKGPKGYKRSDERIREDVCDRLAQADDVDPSDIEVTVSNGEVTLTGFVNARSMKYMAEHIADSVLGVNEIHNQLRIKREEETSTATSAARMPSAKA